MREVALIGCGAIGAGVLALLADDPAVRVSHVVVPTAAVGDARDTCARLAPGAEVVDRLDLDRHAPDLIVECAGHAAVHEHVLPALTRGVPCVVTSIGALADADGAGDIEAAARRGDTRVTLISGAIGGIDALAAARLGGLSAVSYTGRKPPQGWKGSAAEQVCDLNAITEATVIFEGSAREAARLYPKNANVAATVSLAGIGLDDTRACLIADPAVTRNVHHVLAVGAFGEMEITLRGEPLPTNPRTSALTVYSVVRAIRNLTGVISL